MRIAVDSLFEIKDELLIRSWEGQQWVAYESVALLTNRQQVHCFLDYQSACRFCQHGSGRFVRRIKVLADVLNVLKNGPEANRIIYDYKAINELVKSFPISAYLPDQDIAAQLLTGQYYPIIWHKTIQPLQVIDQYHIIAQQFPDTQARIVRHNVKTVFSGDQFGDMLQAFDEIVRMHSVSGMDKPNFFLLGQFRDLALTLTEEGFPRDNCGILLYAAYAVYEHNAREKTYRTGPVAEVTAPLTQCWPLFIRLNEKGTALDFYNGDLKSMVPGTSVKYMDLSYYSFDPIKVNPV